MADANTTTAGDMEAIQKLKGAYDKMRAEIGKAIVGQEQVVEQLLIAVFSRGHCLLVGVPGLAKTLMIRTLAQTLNLSFSRIQFTPDLMPSDITGTEVISEDKATGTRTLQFIKGPIFANLLLADEINRTPPKTQAALLEAMQEYQVSAGGKKHPLTQPFFVLATQNPIEQEGTYPLPEAQLDRFMFQVNVGYPTEAEELEVMKLTTSPFDTKLQPVLSGADIQVLQDVVRRVPIADHVIRYAMKLTRATRVHGKEPVPDFVRQWVSWGAGPRASQYLIIGAKARAILKGRFYVSSEDIRAVAHPVLRHRVLCNFAAEAEGVTSDKIVDKLIEVTPAAEGDATKDPRMPRVLGPAQG
ncbi:MAG: MoxR-like [Planctomycetota bacterium]|nr:MAG: MoxR-like [Planctomycetota bacterium]